MFSRLPLLAATLFLSLCACAQTDTTPPAKQSHILPTVEQLLPAHTYTVSIMDKVRTNPRFMVLSQKMQEAARKNPEQFLQLQKEAVASKNGLSYDPRMGLSKAEYEELQTLVEKRDMRVESSGSEEVVVSTVKGIIRFSTQGRLDILNSVWIDLSKNEAHIEEYTLPFVEKLSVDSSNNAYGTSWSGYKWEYNSPEHVDFTNMDMDKLKTLDMMQFKLIVGRLDSTGRTLIQIKGQQIERGVKTLSFETPLFF